MNMYKLMYYINKENSTINRDEQCEGLDNLVEHTNRKMRKVWQTRIQFFLVNNISYLNNLLELSILQRVSDSIKYNTVHK